MSKILRQEILKVKFAHAAPSSTGEDDEGSAFMLYAPRSAHGPPHTTSAILPWVRLPF